jgi:hypothetical protein
VHEDIGVVARRTDDPEEVGTAIDAVATLVDDIDDPDEIRVRTLYTRMMPCDLPNSPSAPLHFEVPFINQFYTTVRYNSGTFEYDEDRSMVVYKPD